LAKEETMEMPATEKGDLLAAYNAIVGYHNNLVSMRFTIAGLYLAASGLLAGSMFNSDWSGTTLVLPILGLALTLIAWLLEVRTYCLLENLGQRGISMESKLSLGDTGGFFDLMNEQPLPPKIPFSRKPFKNQTVIRFISHSWGLNLLYVSISTFWLLMLLYFAFVD
jgi:hypothetical protein